MAFIMDSQFNLLRLRRARFFMTFTADDSQMLSSRLGVEFYGFHHAG